MKKFLKLVAILLCIPLLFGVVSVLAGGTGALEDDSSEIPAAPYLTLQPAGFSQDASGEVTISYTVNLMEISQLLADGYEVAMGVLVARTPREEEELKVKGSFEMGYGVAGVIGEACVFYCSDPDNQSIVNYPVVSEGESVFTFTLKVPNVGFLDGEGIIHRGFVSVYKEGKENVTYTYSDIFTFWGGIAYLGTGAPEGYISMRMTTVMDPEPAWKFDLVFDDVSDYTDKGYRVLVGYTSMTDATYSYFSNGKSILECAPEEVNTPEWRDGYLIWTGASALQIAYDSELDGEKNEVSFSRTPYSLESETGVSFLYVAVCLVDAEGNTEVLKHGPSYLVYGNQMVSSGSFYYYLPV